MTKTAGMTRQNLADILRFYAEAGVDDALDDVAANRLVPAKVEAAPPRVETRPSEAAPAVPTRSVVPGFDEAARSIPDAVRMPPTTVPDGAQAVLAKQLATTALTLDELREAMAGFDGCNLKFTAKNMVFADGNPDAALMLIGEAPGRDEDLEGLPFVGRSGKLLDRILAAIGLDRTSAYIANVIPWRPPGNRTPTPHETEICRPFIERQIELAAPKVIVTLGGPSAKVVLNAAGGILKLRGNWHTHTTAGGRTIPVMPTLHPAYLLRTPAHKRFVWRDFLEVKAKLRELG